ncbi:hypothetical protein BGP_5609 [Beggiatoa sp. PS]|nr:hypothetical protein BGP_5609 [Beggiatoa sp. PS]
MLFLKKIVFVDSVFQINNFTKGRHVGLPLHHARRGEPACSPSLSEIIFLNLEKLFSATSLNLYLTKSKIYFGI